MNFRGKKLKTAFDLPHPRFVNYLTNYDKILLSKVPKNGQSLQHKYEQIDDQNSIPKCKKSANNKFRSKMTFTSDALKASLSVLKKATEEEEDELTSFQI